ncbi:NlpC/P60 family protein [Corynebacterium callunae]|uniref:C40 family peptidase n=1 Tax=Corynebacterium callunae TaxID=1721 RepID=UPI003982BB48
MFTRRWVGLVTSGVLLCSLLQSPHAAFATEVDQLIAEMDTISQTVSAQNEEVKQLEQDVIAREAHVAEIQNEVNQLKAAADLAAQNVEANHGDIDKIAQAKYRGTVLDPISIAVSAENPQNAIDRMSYLRTLSKTTSEAVESLQDASAESAEALGKANRAKAEAEFQLGDLKARLDKLNKEKQELDVKQAEIKDRVNQLSQQERELWIAKNGPVDININDFLGSGTAASAAVDAALSKLGSPYGWGAAGPNEFDCSGLIFWAYQQMGKTLPRTSQAQMAGGTPVSKDELQPGDVIGYYPGATHVGMYIGDGKIVHASDYGIPVQVVSVDSAPFYGARRY